MKKVIKTALLSLSGLLVVTAGILSVVLTAGKKKDIYNQYPVKASINSFLQQTQKRFSMPLSTFMQTLHLIYLEKGLLQ